MVPVYERMSDTNLLGKMVKGKTQHANKSLHNVIWSLCPKTVFVGVVVEYVVLWHLLLPGSMRVQLIFLKLWRSLAIERNDIINIYIEARDNERIYKAAIASNPTIKRKCSKNWLESTSTACPGGMRRVYLTVQVHFN